MDSVSGGFIRLTTLDSCAGRNEAMLRSHDRRRTSDVGGVTNMCGVYKKYLWYHRVNYNATPTIRIDQRDSLDKILVSMLPVMRLNALVLSPVRPYRNNDFGRLGAGPVPLPSPKFRAI